MNANKVSIRRQNNSKEHFADEPVDMRHVLMIHYGEGWASVDVTADTDGAMYLTAKEGRLVIEPVGGNCVRIFVKPFV